MCKNKTAIYIASIQYNIYIIFCSFECHNNFSIDFISSSLGYTHDRKQSNIIMHSIISRYTLCSEYLTKKNKVEIYPRMKTLFQHDSGAITV